MKIKAFTLAEVLITLAVIGVVAALTMPQLIAKYQKDITVVRLKKAYTVLSQAYQLSQVVNGSAKNWEYVYQSGNKNNDIKYVKKYILPYLKVLKTCEDDSTECFTDSVTYMDNSKIGINNMFAFILADGTSIAILVLDMGEGPYGVVFVDINGKKAPNKMGKDIFRIGFDAKQGVNMTGITYTRDEMLNGTELPYGCNKNGTGEYCGALIQYDGWKISNDYPW